MLYNGGAKPLSDGTCRSDNGELIGNPPAKWRLGKYLIGFPKGAS
jgi:hypothetical protein